MQPQPLPQQQYYGGPGALPPPPQAYYAGAPPAQAAYAGAQQQQPYYYSAAPPSSYYAAPAAAAVTAPYAAYAVAPGYPTPPGGYPPQGAPFYGQQQVVPAGAMPAGYSNSASASGFFFGAGGAGAQLSPEQQALVNEQSYHDEANWRCGRYYGRYDSRLWVPARRGCASRTANHAHPAYRRLVVAVILIVVVSQVVQILLRSRSF